MPNFATSSALVDTATKCFATAFASPSRQAPVASRVRVGDVSSVVKVFEQIDEQRLGRIEVARGLDDVGAVDVGHEAEGEATVAVVPSAS